MQQGLDERPPDGVQGRGSRRFAGTECAQALEVVGPVAGSLAEQQRRANGRGPQAVGTTEQRRQGLPELLRPEGLGCKE